MAEFDPLATQRDITPGIADELRETGFENVQLIGHGGFGVVYRCWQPLLDRTVAVKVLTSGLDSENLARFFREQKAMGRLSGHPNIVNVHDVGTTVNGRPFIVMQYHQLGSLEEEIRRNGPQEWPAVLRLGVKMAGALEAIHRMGILHRDVKPGNILITEYGEPQLTDFGISHISGGFETAQGAVTGSPAFTAPEILQGTPPSVHSDIYSLGATLFCAITGHAAFTRHSGESLVAQFVRIAREPVPDLTEWSLPNDVSELVERTMSRTVADRPKSAEELGNLLRDAERRHGCEVDSMALPAASATQVMAPTEVGAADEWALGRHSLASSPVPLRRKDGNLPVELTSFVGRRHELTEAKRLLSESHLVTFTGTGGVGKTRLALRVGAESRRSFSDGVWLVELGRIRDPMLMPETFVAVLGLRERSLRSPLRLLSEYLVERQLLIIVDNCEHLIAAIAELIEPLLQGCPGLRIITTSREPLRIGGEIVMRVPPLTIPAPDHPVRRGESSSDAVQLFVARARTALPEFELTDDNKATIGQICKHLDGLPLPIELAAARLRAMSATQILNRLADRYSLLNRGNRGAPNRQQSLRLSVDWSYDLCSSREQVLWAHLSIFSGGFDLDGAEGVAGSGSDPGDLLDVLESLVDKSILIREEFSSGVRFRMLEVLREYGREKLAERGEDAQLRLRHRDWCLQLVQDAEREWISPHQPDWIARLQREQANIRDALEYCVAVAGQARAGLRIAVGLYPFWFTRGLFGEGRRWLDRLLALDDDSPTPERVEALYIAGELAGLQGDLQAGWSLLARARELADRLGNAEVLSGVRYVEGNLAMYGGDPARALACFEEALGGLNTESTLVRRIETLVAQGVAGWLLDDIPLSAASHDEVLRITESRGEAVYRAYSLWALGLVAWRQGHSDRGVGYLEKGVRLARRVDDPVSGALCLEALSWIAAGEHHAEKAAVLMGAARALRKAVGSTSVHIPGVADFHQRCEQRTRHTLGDQAYTVAFERGKGLTFAEAAAYALDENPPPSPRTADSVLTRRESQVARLVADGLTNREIATKLVISPRTAQGHVEHILAKLGFTSRAQIAAWFAEQGSDS